MWFFKLLRDYLGLIHLPFFSWNKTHYLIPAKTITTTQTIIPNNQTSISNSIMSQPTSYTEKVSFNADIKNIRFDNFLGNCEIFENDGIHKENIRIETVFHDKDSKDDYKIYFNHETLYLESKNQNASMTINGNVYIGNGGISIINGVVYGAEKAKEAPKTKLYVPSGLNLTLNGKCTEIQSNVSFKDVDLNLSGQSQVVIKRVLNNIRGSMKNQSNFECPKALSVQVNMEISNQSSCKILGSLKSVNIQTKNQASFVTNGKCEGDYVANSSGQSSINHLGSVLGKILKYSSNQSSINIK